MILVASGGLGPEVSPALRAVTTPGFTTDGAADLPASGTSAGPG